MIRKGLVINKRYKTIRKLGIGGTGEVWECEDQLLERMVALKFFNEVYYSDNPKVIKIIEEQVKLQSKLIGHPNIVNIFDYGTYSDSKLQTAHYYIVMECLEGINLDQWINSYSKKVDKKTAYNINLLIAWEVCKAINYAHSKEVYHRDIKPSNILLSKNGFIKIGDFGLVQSMEAAITNTMWHSAAPAYCSPEQWNGEGYTKESDMYQLGCTLYQLFTGRLPYSAHNLYDLMKAHLNDAPVKVREINPITSEEVSNCIDKTLLKDSDERGGIWEICDALAEELNGVYYMDVDVSKKPSPIHELVSEITEFGEDRLAKEVAGFYFPDFSEALSEAMQLILNDITSVKAHKITNEAAEEAAATT